VELSESRDQRRWRVDRPELAALRRVHDQAALSEGNRALEVDEVAWPIDVAPLEPEQLALAHTDVEERPYGELVVRVPLRRSRENLGNAFGLEHNDMGSRVVPQAEELAEARGRIPVEKTVLDGLVKDRAQSRDEVLYGISCQRRHAGLTVGSDGFVIRAR